MDDSLSAARAASKRLPAERTRRTACPYRLLRHGLVTPCRDREATLLSVRRLPHAALGVT